MREREGRGGEEGGEGREQGEGGREEGGRDPVDPQGGIVGGNTNKQHVDTSSTGGGIVGT